MPGSAGPILAALDEGLPSPRRQGINPLAKEQRPMNGAWNRTAAARLDREAGFHPALS